MPKKCSAKGCKYNVFAKKFCAAHQRLRDDFKYPVNKRKAIKKVSTKGRKKQQEKKGVIHEDHLFYSEIWEERDHFSFESDTYLGSEPLTIFFHHCLPKALYPQFRYKKWNIVLITWEEHSKAESNLDFVPKVKAYTEELKKIYL